MSRIEWPLLSLPKEFFPFLSLITGALIILKFLLPFKKLKLFILFDSVCYLVFLSSLWGLPYLILPSWLQIACFFHLLFDGQYLYFYGLSFLHIHTVICYVSLCSTWPNMIFSFSLAEFMQNILWSCSFVVLLYKSHFKGALEMLPYLKKEVNTIWGLT